MGIFGLEMSLMSVTRELSTEGSVRRGYSSCLHGNPQNSSVQVTLDIGHDILVHCLMTED